jgi:hypothetical protein
MLPTVRPTAEIGHSCGGSLLILALMQVIAVLPVLAAGFAVPQFVPQLLKLHRTNDTAGLSTAWALLTGINNAAWFGYFAASRYWVALIPSSSAALLGGCLGVTLARRTTMTCRVLVTIGAWAIVLCVAASVDRRFLGATLAGAFLIQVIPAVAAAHRIRRPTGVAAGTWRLILGEVTCWAVYGVANHDPPLIVLGTTGATSAVLMLNRARLAARGSRRLHRLAEVTAAGAIVEEPAHDVGGGRRVATVTDSDGNVLGLLQD